MRTVVYVDPDREIVLKKRIEEVRGKRDRARLESTVNQYGFLVDALVKELNELSQQINPKFVENLLFDINLKVLRYQKRYVDFKEKFEKDPVTFLKWNQTDFVIYVEMQRIMTRLYKNIVEIQKIESDLGVQVLKIYQLFGLFQEQMNDRVLRWAENPYGSSSPQSNLTEASEVSANSKLINNMGDFRNLYGVVKEAYQFWCNTPKSVSTECTASQASA